MSRTAEIAGNNIKYHVMDPTGNITILVETPVAEASQPFVAAKLMELEPEVEQVGFLTLAETPEPDRSGCLQQEMASQPEKTQQSEKIPLAESSQNKYDIALRMAGGEFCGNATMSAAAFYAEKTGLKEGTVVVRVSGAEKPVPVEISRLDGEEGGRSSFRGIVAMPPAQSISEVYLPVQKPDTFADEQERSKSYTQAGVRKSRDGIGFQSQPEAESGRETGIEAKKCTVVHFEGIDHVILEESPDRKLAEALAPVWCRALQADAIGLMFLERLPSGEQNILQNGMLTPLVYVPEAGTLVWENSCASGTSAVGVWAADVLKRQEIMEDTAKADKGKSFRKGTAFPQKGCLHLQEPGGILSVRVSPDGEIRLEGVVRERV